MLYLSDEQAPGYLSANFCYCVLSHWTIITVYSIKHCVSLIWVIYCKSASLQLMIHLSWLVLIWNRFFIPQINRYAKGKI